MADDEDSMPKVKDLAFLKNQLEHLQRQLEEEVKTVVEQEGSFLSAPFLKGFLAGYFVAKLRASAVMGFAPASAAQSYAVPNIEKTLQDYLRSSASSALLSPGSPQQGP
ncbi:SLC35A4 upstream open reading frame protein-like [Macrotis lagotis]|uniref:SLC35A4 upstream open reading frame protein-like n=1 Tax=Macrotis lagotis TaxID=92651 RepID=UPI003D6905EB